MDDGATWRSIVPGKDAMFSRLRAKVHVRATLTGVGTTLGGLDVLGVYEMNPVRYLTRFLKPVHSFAITNPPENTKAIPEIDEAGNKTTYGYDALDNIAKVTDALKQVTQYTYDKNGHLTSETDALGNKVQYIYTPEGWLSSIVKADGTILTFEYDKTGHLLTQSIREDAKFIKQNNGMQN